MVEEFAIYLKDIRGFSQKTIEAYTKDIKAFANWVNANHPGMKWSTITRDVIDAYIIYQSGRGLAPATTNRQISSISAIFNYFKRNGWEGENPCKYESRRKRPKTIPNTIPIEDIKKAYTSSVGVTRVMLGLLATTAIRIQELLDLKYEDIDYKECSIRIKGKGNKERVVFTSPEQLEVLRAGFEDCHFRGKIFTIDQRTARFMVWEALKPFSTAKQLSPHAIRHTIATNLAKNGANNMMIGNILGHEHLKTSQKYIDLSKAEPKAMLQDNNILTINTQS